LRKVTQAALPETICFRGQIHGQWTPEVYFGFDLKFAKAGGGSLAVSNESISE
jgi:hypothetical protein